MKGRDAGIVAPFCTLVTDDRDGMWVRERCTPADDLILVLG